MALDPFKESIREIEVVVGIVVIFSLTKAGANEINSHWKPCNYDPDSEYKVNHESLEEKLGGASVHEVEKPLLGSIRSVVPHIASCICLLVVEIDLSVPGPVLHLWYTQALSVDQSHILGIAQLVMCQSSSYCIINDVINWSNHKI